jgi:hypothetical protein
MSIIKNLFLSPHAVAKHLDAPLLDEREQYLSYLRAGGRNRRQLQNVSGCLVGISRTLDATGLQPISRDEVRVVASKLAAVPGGRFRQRSYINYLGRAAGWLKHLNCLAEKSHPYRDCLREFQRMLSEDLKLSPSTVSTRYFRIARFLRWQLLYVSGGRGPSWEDVVRLLNSLNGPEPLSL